MKKLLFVAAVAAFSFASCTKDLTCTCTNSTASGGVTVTGQPTVTMYEGVKKSDAALTCPASTVNTGGTGTGAWTSTTTCTLK